MSSTPLMSEFPVEKAASADHPIYILNEPDVELVVGAPKTCFWGRLCGRKGASACHQRQKSPIRRAIKWFLAFILVIGLGGFFFARHHIRGHWKLHAIVCVPLQDATTSVELPLANQWTRIGIHPSLFGGDAHITHSDDVKNGTVVVTFDVPKDTELSADATEAGTFVCHIAGPHFVGLGIHSKDKHGHGHGHHLKAVSTTITLPASEAGKARPISFHGYRRRFGHHCMRKRIRKAIAKAVRVAKAAKLMKIENDD